MKTFINNRWVTHKNKLGIYNPYHGEKVGEVPILDFTLINKAINTMSEYSPSLTPYERYIILQKTAQAVITQKEELSHLITEESGLCLKSTEHEVERAYQTLLFSAEEAKRLEGTTYSCDIIPQKNDRIGITLFEPVGTILAITPFNHPLNQVVHKVAPAIAANNRVLLKPSEKTPLTAIRFVEILLESGLPKGMIAVLTCDIQKISKKLLKHPKIDMVTFTGSTKIGKYIHDQIAIKKSLFELGGNGAFIVLDDADIDRAVKIAVQGAFSNSGQRCTSIKRILLHNDIADIFIKKFIPTVKKLKWGNPFNPETDLGTVIDEEAAQTIETRIKSAIKEGAKLLYGGKRKGALLQPCVLDHVKPEMKLVVQETFGPVAPIIRIRNIKEAIEITNSTIYGLQSGVCTNNIQKAFEVAKRLKVGSVMINEGPGFRVEPLPFGGIKQSGLGREGIQHAIREMSNLKLVTF